MLKFGINGEIYDFIMTAIRGCGPGVVAADSIFAAPESTPPLRHERQGAHHIYALRANALDY